MPGTALDRRAHHDRAPVRPDDPIVAVVRGVSLAVQRTRIDLIILERRAEAEIRQSRLDRAW